MRARCLASVANGAITGTGMPSGSWARIAAAIASYRAPSAGASTGTARMMLSISQYGIRSPMRAISSSRTSPSVVPGRVRQSTCDLGLARDHVVLDARVHDRGAERVAQQRVEHEGVGGVAGGTQRGRRPARVVADDRGHERGLVGRQGGADVREQPPHDRGRPGLARDRDARHDVGGADQRVVVARHRAVAPPAAHPDAVGLVALLRDHDRVEPPPADLDRHAARLVERAGRADRLRPVVDQPPGAVQAARLLVGGGRRTARRGAGRGRRRRPGRGRPSRARAAEQPEHADLERHHRLHVDRAAPPDVAVGDLARRTADASSPRAPRGRRRGATGAAAGRRRCRRRGAARPRCRGRARAPGPRARGRPRAARRRLGGPRRAPARAGRAG